MKQPLLIVDDDETIRSQMKWALMSDYEVILAEDRASAVESFRINQPMVVLLDLGLPPNPADVTEGLATLGELLAINSSSKIIITTGQADRRNAVQAIGAGAYDFFPKPVEMEELKVILKRAFHLAQIERENHAMQQRLSGDGFEGMLGSSPKMQEVFSTIRKVATSDAPVLILGESGTGKEMVAQAIHQRSNRKSGPFIAINCGAIPETLLESELFGHEKGAFTGAHAQRKGRFEMATGGSLFLDEIGELTAPLQVKMLRFLQEKCIERVGGRVQIEIDARVIAATHNDLQKGMGDGRFREDLFYRLAVVTIKLPSLRERVGDISMLAHAFIKRFALETGKDAPKFTDDALRAMELHPWVGNVRELENKVRRAVIMADGRRIKPEDLELAATAQAAGPRKTLKEARETVEREIIVSALDRHNGKISRAAVELGVSRPTLYELMEKLAITRDNLAKE